jgi:hypothetical protein
MQFDFEALIGVMLPVVSFVTGIVLAIGVPKAIAGFKAWVAAKELAIYNKIKAELKAEEAKIKTEAFAAVSATVADVEVRL